jgi:hypothetical protein
MSYWIMEVDNTSKRLGIYDQSNQVGDDKEDRER